MSDFDNSSSAGIDAALDNALASVSEARSDRAEIADAIEAGDLPPTALSTSGLWDDAKKKAEEKRNAAKEKAKADKASKGEDKAEKLHKMDVQGNKRRAQEEGLDDALDRALAKSSEKQKQRGEDRQAQAKGEKPGPMSAKEWARPDVATARKNLSSRFPGVKLSERLQSLEAWGDAFARDPAAAAEAIRDQYLRVAPSLASRTETTKAGKTVSDAVDKGFESGSDLADIKSFADKYGSRLPGLLIELDSLERDLIADPVGASARLAAKFGALDRPQAPQQPQQAPVASQPEDHQRVTLGLQKVIEHNVLPGLANDQIADAVAMVLENMPRTADRFADLQRAYLMVVPGHQAMPAPHQATPAAQSNNAGLKSIHGAPSSTGGNSRSRGKGSLDDALHRAFGGI